MASSFSFDTSGFQSAKVMDKKLQRAVMATMKFWDGPAEEHMKHHAPWTDRTTNARNGLAAKAVKLKAHLWGIILSHSVDYGVYLELGHHHEPDNGDPYDVKPYPIIMPTVRMFAPKVIGTLTKILNRLG